ncbi:hypothetical protein Tco_0632097, partial [Tanacetum coccineum]
EFEQDDVHNHSEDPLASAMLLLAKAIHNHSEDPLASAMLLLAKAITQNFSNPTNNHVFVLRLIPEIKQSFKVTG